MKHFPEIEKRVKLSCEFPQLNIIPTQQSLINVFKLAFNQISKTIKYIHNVHPSSSLTNLFIHTLSFRFQKSITCD